MAVATHNVKADQGASLEILFRWKDSAGDPVDITGYLARLQVRVEVADADPILDLDNGAKGGITLQEGGDVGLVAIRAAPAVTALWPAPELAFYDLELEAPDGTVTRLVQGRFRILAEVTR